MFNSINRPTYEELNFDHARAEETHFDSMVHIMSRDIYVCTVLKGLRQFRTNNNIDRVKV